jgi:hypothetical protein
MRTCEGRNSKIKLREEGHDLYSLPDIRMIKSGKMRFGGA